MVCGKLLLILSGVLYLPSRTIVSKFAIQRDSYKCVVGNLHHDDRDVCSTLHVQGVQRYWGMQTVYC